MLEVPYPTYETKMRTKPTTYRLFNRFPSRSLPLPFLGKMAAIVIFLMMIPSITLGEDDVKFRRESRFREAINRPLTANGERAKLRDYLRRLSGTREVSVLLDRRIDPNQRINIAIAAETFDEGIHQLVNQVGVDVTITGDTLIVGPPETIRNLRTRIEISRETLNDIEDLSPKQQFVLLRRYEVHWEDLTTPQEILTQVSNRYQINIENLDAVPHDLWAAGTIAYPNLVEALTVVLTQFQLSFEWVSQKRIRIIPEIPQVAIERTHRPKGMTLDEAILVVKREFPRLKVTQKGRQFTFSGRIEDHESVAVLIGERPPRRQASSTQQTTQLRDRRFTLKMVRKPFGSLMATLQSQGIEVRYDAQALKESGADLAQKISLELKQATIDQLLNESCQKVGLTYEINGNVIILKVESTQ